MKQLFYRSMYCEDCSYFTWESMQVKVIQAARNDEDWQNLARTPMIILIAVTVGDILTNLIIGGAGGGAGG